jgi:hypothetical protein
MKNSFREQGHRAPREREMVLKSIRWLSFFSFIVILCTGVIPTRDVHALTDLDLFVEQVKNGQADQLRGIYIPGVLAAPVVQQPSEQGDFVSPRQNIVTQFSMASKVGSTGLLAHNYLAGSNFALLKGGEDLYLVYGDGQVTQFTVSEILQYKALEPASPSSKFVDIESGSTLTHSALFLDVYDRPGQVILQTCIEKDNDRSWGRLFIIAEPAVD